MVLEPLDAAGVAAAPITLSWTSNAVVKAEELTADASTGAPGTLMIASPAAALGVTGLNLVTTGPAVVQVIALG